MKKTLLFTTLFISSFITAFGQNNFTCETAQNLSVGSTCTFVEGTLVHEVVSTLDIGAETFDIYGTYYSFVATSQAALVSVSTDFDSDIDIMIHRIEGGCPSPAVLVMEVDDNEVGGEEYLFKNIEIGQTYYFIVTHYSYVQGVDGDVFEVCVTDVPVPANDLCSGALALTPIDFTTQIQQEDFTFGYTSTATLDEGFQGTTCVADPGLDVWYSFVAEAQEAVVFTAPFGLSKLALSVYRGNCDELVASACVSGVQYQDVQLNLTNLVVGETYLIRLEDEYNNYFEDHGLFGIVVINPEGLAVSKVEESTIAVYPNPVKDVITIDAKTEITSIDVKNALGQVVASQSGSNAMSVKLDTTSFDNGLYVITIYTNGEKVTKKINVVK